MDLRADGADRAILQIPVTAENDQVLPQLLDELDALWGGEASDVTATGGDTINALINRELHSGQVTSVILTLAAALVILVGYFGRTQRRPALGVITVLPIAMVVTWLLGAMWLFGISYNVLTALIVALTIGIGVDYTIHLTHRFLDAERESGRAAEALAEAMTTTGGALIGSALTTALGLLALLFSPLGPLGELGALTAVTIGLTLVATFTVLPALLVMWSNYHDRRRVSGAGTAGVTA